MPGISMEKASRNNDPAAPPTKTAKNIHAVAETFGWVDFWANGCVRFKRANWIPCD
jgi:hypothetical protein